MTLNSNLKDPKKYEWVKKQLSQYLVVKTEKHISPAMAFVLKRTGKLAGTTYKMFIESTQPIAVKKYLEAHEAGHIIFGHITQEDVKDQINKIKIKAAWPRVKDFFNNEKEWEDRFDSLIYNIVMDMEVNSKIFEKEEFEEFGKAIGAKGIWPEDYGFPIGLDYNSYLSLVLFNPENFLEKMNENSQNNNDENNENSQNDSGNGNDEKNKNDNDGNNDNNKVKESNSLSEKGNSKKSIKISKQLAKELKKYFEENNKEENEKTAARLEIEDFNNKKTPSKTGAQTAEVSIEGNVIKISELEKELKKQLIEVKRNANRNILYNYNRNKQNTNIIIPRVEVSRKIEKPCLYTLLDVSGSISTSMVSDFCNAFKNASKSLNRKSRIVLWNTQLVKDAKASESFTPLAGGGTRIADGINYLKKNYSLRPEDILYIVSDFEDSLEDWERELRNIKSKKNAVLFHNKEDYTTLEDIVKSAENNKEVLKLLSLAKVIEY